MVRVEETDEFLVAAGSVVVTSKKEAVGVLADRWATHGKALDNRSGLWHTNDLGAVEKVLGVVLQHHSS